MPTVLDNSEILTLADMMNRLGGVPLDRIRFKPSPGTAVEQDVIDLHDRERRLFELVEGVLIEKTYGLLESVVTVKLIRYISDHVENHDLGIVLGADAAMRFAPGLVRMPDVSVVFWNRLPGRRIPREPIPELVPDLAVEVISLSNTRAEINRKIEEYFVAGANQVWTVDPRELTVTVYQSSSTFTTLTGTESISRGDLLPGFDLRIDELFRRAGVLQD